MTIEIHGRCDDRFERLRQVFEANFANDLELGASLAVTVDGELAVDLWGGYADPHKTRPWREDTIVLVFSSTKFPTTLCALMLVDQGELELDVPVAHYWPEFGIKGKDKVLVRHVFAHSAGVPGYEPPIPFATQYDWQAITTALADQGLWWEPGTQSCYHGSTYGFLMGELIRRISGMTPGQFLKAEITHRLGVDFTIGLDRKEFRRMAATEQVGEREQPEAGSLRARMARSFLPPAWQGSACLTSEMPGANGLGNARSMAQLAAILAMNGELGGYRLLAPKTIDLLLTEQSYRHDPFFEADVRWGLGVGLHSVEFPCLGEGSVHWGGFGGSFLIADRDYRVSIAYAMNRLLPGVTEDPRTLALRTGFIETVAR